jgi:hypothetical protein
VVGVGLLRPFRSSLVLFQFHSFFVVLNQSAFAQWTFFSGLGVSGRAALGSVTPGLAVAVVPPTMNDPSLPLA